MKNLIYFLITTAIVLILSHQPTIAQTSDQQHSELHKQMYKAKTYEAWVTPIGSSSKIKGYLSEIGDSLTIISHYPNYEKQRININDVKEIKFRKNGKIGWGVLQGGLTGFVAGAIFGFVVGSSPCKDGDLCIFSPADTAIYFGAKFAVPGALIGAALGSAAIKIPINGNAKNHQRRLKRYKLVY